MWCDEQKGVVQRDHELSDLIVRKCGLKLVPIRVLRLAHEEYSRHHNQSLERIQDRGGFSVLEVIELLSDRIERENGRRVEECGA